MPNSNGSNDKKTLSIIYSITSRRCPPLATTSLGQAVSPIEKYVVSRWSQFTTQDFKDKHIENQALGLLIFVQHTTYQAILGNSAKKSSTKQLEYRP